MELNYIKLFILNYKSMIKNKFKFDQLNSVSKRLNAITKGIHNLSLEFIILHDNLMLLLI